MNRRLYTAFNALDVLKKNKEYYIPGILGFTINGANIVDVPYRPGYVYVRLHSNLNETVQVYNDKVSPVYGLPVLVVRDDVDTTRYRIYGRDTGAYENWQTSSAYVPRHGDGHSFGSGDITWIYDQQFIPLLVYPSGTYGAGNVMIAGDWIWHNSEWRSVGGTGTVDLLAYKPTGSSASLVLISLDSIGNPKVTAGSFPAVNITGGAALLQYLPDPANYDIPLAMVRLVSGTTNVGWDNIYDLRSFACENVTGTSGGSAFIQATYLVITGSASLTSERIVTAGTGITLQDNGANGTLVINAVSTGTSQRFESQQWMGGALGVSTYMAYYIATQAATLKKVSLWYYDGEVTDSPDHTDWTIRLNGGAIDTFTINGSGNIILEQRSLAQALVAGDYVQVGTNAHVCPSAQDLMSIFEVEV